MHDVPYLAVLPPTTALYKKLKIERQSGMSQTATSMLTSGCVC